MRAYDLIDKKKRGQELTKEEIHYLLSGYVAGKIPDYQMSAFLMAVYFQGMTDEELLHFTLEMEGSGEQMDLSPIEGIKVDKHSTGGVGDKTTLVIGPIVAACGVKMAKMSGRGLGHTGGTIDKLESIPGFRTDCTLEQFYQNVNQTGMCITGQTGNLVPADKKLYALRDVTATVDSLPLIASSIMSKKLAAGSDGIVLDVKMGSGAFMKTLEDAKALAHHMVDIGERAGRRMAAVITDMDLPLGNAIGNSLEVMEAVETLKGQGPEDFTQICLALSAQMLKLARDDSLEDCEKRASEALESGKALQKFKEFVQMQGGQTHWIEDGEGLPTAAYNTVLEANAAGYISHMDAEAFGRASVILGAGRSQKEDEIDFAAGIVLQHKTGAYVKQGETIAVLYSEHKEKLGDALAKLQSAYKLTEEKPERKPLIYAVTAH